MPSGVKQFREVSVRGDGSGLLRIGVVGVLEHHWPRGRGGVREERHDGHQIWSAKGWITVRGGG